MRGQDRGLDELSAVLGEVAEVVRKRVTRPASEPFAEVEEMGRSCSSMTVAEVADLARITDRAVRAAATDGRLAGVKVGTEWRFARDDVDAWLSARSA